MTEIKVRVTFTEEVLGSQPNDAEIYATYVGAKSPDLSTVEDEVAAISSDEENENRSITVFPKDDDGKPFMYDYQWRGFFKETCGALKKVKGTHSEKIKAHKKLIDNFVFVTPRKIPLIIPDGKEIGFCARPLRASTPQGERTALSVSETVPAGTTCEFTICFMEETGEKALVEWLDYGKWKGFGQWRNSGKGKFEYEIIS